MRPVFLRHGAVCTEILEVYILNLQCHCSEIWALDSAVQMAEFKKGRLRQVDENPQILDDYIRAWSLFPALKQVGLIDCFHFALQFCFIEPFLVKKVGFTFVAPYTAKLFDNKSVVAIKDLENNQEASLIFHLHESLLKHFFAR